MKEVHPIRAAIAILMVLLMGYILIVTGDIPAQLGTIVMAVIAFYFGSREG
jgi:hypothetical protein